MAATAFKEIVGRYINHGPLELRISEGEGSGPSAPRSLPCQVWFPSFSSERAASAKSGEEVTTIDRTQRTTMEAMPEVAERPGGSHRIHQGEWAASCQSDHDASAVGEKGKGLGFTFLFHYDPAYQFFCH